MKIFNCRYEIRLAMLGLTLLLCQLSTAQTSFWGMTSEGGVYDQGTIFQTDADGNNLNPIHDFEVDIYGIRPEGGLLLASNGKFYGMTGGSMQCGGGVLFVYDPATGEYSEKHQFQGTDGKRPRGHLMQAADGYIYGMTYLGGVNVGGVIFRYDINADAYTQLYDFIPQKGANPTGSLVQAPNGKLYGMTFYGGADNKGVLFEFDPTDNTYTPKLDFEGDLGIYPYGSLVVASNGFLYGMAFQGGKNGEGVIFEYQPDQETYAKKIDLGYNIGIYPIGSLMEASNGKLYGMTTKGGANNRGTLFEYNFQSNIYTKKFDFDNSGSGINPDGRLSEGPNGLLYGINHLEGTNGYGSVFSFDLQTETYTSLLGLGADVELTVSNLIYDGNDGFYGLSTEGGAWNQGTIFEYSKANNSYQIKVDLGDVKDGRVPTGSLVEGTDGRLYGTTSLGGVCDRGVLVAIDPSSFQLSAVDSFSNIAGNVPAGKLFQANDGKFYGVTTDGGAEQRGVIFSYDENEGLTTRHYLLEGEGSSPKAGLIQAGNGKLYGMTTVGGEFDLGVLYEFDPVDDIYIVRYHFNETDGAKPVGALLQASNGLLYGLTVEGGSSGKGVLFSYDIISGSYTVRAEFNVSNGANPMGTLVEQNGKLFGLATEGGAFYLGVLFQFELATNTFSKKIDFDVASGGHPQGSLLVAANGRLYGLCRQMGAQYMGTLFQYDPATELLTKKSDFNGTNGSRPLASLLETGGCLSANAPSLTAEQSPETNNGLGAIDLTISGGTGPFTFDWDKDGIGDNDDPEDLTDLAAGTYLVLVTDANGCQTALQATVESLVGTAELEDIFVTLYPNPAQDNLHLSLNGNVGLKLNLEVTDILGRTLLSQNLEGKEATVSLEGFAAGVYFLRLEQEGRGSVFRFVVE